MIPSDYENKNIKPGKYKCPKCDGQTGIKRRRKDGNKTTTYKQCEWCNHTWDAVVTIYD